jgi:hypothetical protein
VAPTGLPLYSTNLTTPSWARRTASSLQARKRACVLARVSVSGFVGSHVRHRFALVQHQLDYPVVGPQLRAKVLERTRQAPPDGSTHWSLRKMAAGMKVNKNLSAV